MTGSRPDIADASPEELARHTAHGDVGAFARIIRLHHADMTKTAFVITGDLDAAVEAVGVAWPAAWRQLRRRRVPTELGPWLCSFAATEAVVVARCGGAPWVASPVQPAGSAAPVQPAGPAAPPGGDELGRALARLDPEDRALLALHHLAGLSVDELGRRHRRSKPPVAVKLDRLGEAIAGPPSPGSDPALQEGRVERLLADYAGVPVWPVDADTVARRARAGEAEERTRLVSIAVAASIAAFVTSLPYLSMLFAGRQP